MSKRRCPFDLDLCRQMKIHVGEKEIAQKSNQNNMLSIYERTLKALREGSKFTSKNPSQYGGNKVASSDLCGCCRIIDYSKPSRCFYCDQVMCFQCLVQCATCSGSFCQSCSLTLYDNEQHNVCLTCYK